MRIWSLILLTLAALTGTAVAANFYVATNGNDSNPCSLTQPCLTISAGRNKLTQAGDTLFIRGGTYSGSSNRIVINSNTPAAAPKSGTSWATATRISAMPITTPGGCDPRGASGPAVRTACQGTTYEDVVMTLSTSDSRISLTGGPNQRAGGIRYFILEGLKIRGGGFVTSFNTEGGNCGTSNDAPDHIRLMNSEVSGGFQSGIHVSQHTFAFEFLNLNVFENGDSTRDHGIYISGDDHLIDGNQFHHNSGYGIHYYHNGSTDPCAAMSTNPIIQNNRSYANNAGAIIQGPIQSGMFRNNLIYGNNGLGVNVSSSLGVGHEYLNNTIWANGGVGIQVLGSGDNAVIKNNITDGLDNGHGATGVVLENNLTSSTADHKFVDAVNGDFRLTSTSPARNAGQNLGSLVTTDFLGLARPQEGVYDIGAHEFRPGGTDTLAPKPPTSPAANAVSVTQINLTWTPPTQNTDNSSLTDLVGYRLHRCIGGGCSPSFYKDIPIGSSHSDTGLTGATLYRYQIAARDDDGNLSTFTTTVEATTQDPPTPVDTLAPKPPTALVVQAMSPSEINLGWTAPTQNTDNSPLTDLAGYRVHRCQGAGCTPIFYQNLGTAAGFTDSGLQASTVYRYQVAAVDDDGNVSTFTAVGQATTLDVPTPPAFDFTLAATDLPAMQQNASVTSTLTLQLLSGTAGPVTFSSSGLPAGASATFTPTSCTPPCTSILTIQATTGTPAGTYAITVSGTAGSLVRSAPLSLPIFCLLPGECP